MYIYIYISDVYVEEYFCAVPTVHVLRMCASLPSVWGPLAFALHFAFRGDKMSSSVFQTGSADEQIMAVDAFKQRTSIDPLMIN